MKINPSSVLNALILMSLISWSSSHAAEPNWENYDALLSNYVEAGNKNKVSLNLVNYAALAKDDRFSGLITTLDQFDISLLATREEKLAFYINAYNILALKTITDNWPLDSIKDLGGLFSPVWKRVAGRLNGREVSLNEVEHNILRKMNEPRIHFAIVCASVSCPDLRTEAFRAAHLDQQLDAQSTSFLNNSDKGLRTSGKRVEVSRIFKWFKTDFDSAGGVAQFIIRYVPLPADAKIRPSISYDWSVNAH